MGKVKEISILTILLMLARNKKKIIITTFIVSIISIVYILIVPQYWESHSSFLPDTEESSGFSLGSSLLGLGSSMLGNSQTVASLDLVTIMSSRTFIEDVINNFDLITYFEIEEEDINTRNELAVKMVRENVVGIGISDETGLVTIAVETKDKKISMDIANYYVDKIEEYSLNSRMNKGRQQRQFLETRIQEVNDDIELISNRLIEFQKNSNMISDEAQTQAIITLYSELVSQSMINDLEYEVKRDLYGSDNPQVKSLGLKSNLIEKKIMELESESSKFKYQIALDNIPESIKEYTRLKMELEVNAKIYEFLLPQLEQAKIQEIKETPTIEVVDKARIAGLRSKPKRGQFCVYMFIFAILTSSVFVIISEMLNDSQKIIIKEIKKSLFSFNASK